MANPLAKCSVGLVIYRTPVAELLPLFDLLAGDGAIAEVLVFDNQGDVNLREEVTRRGWFYGCAGRNLGFGAGHNRLLANVSLEKSSFHLILNPDVTWPSSPLPVLLSFLTAHPECGAVMPDVRNEDGSRQFLAKRLPSPLILFGRRFLPKFEWLRCRIAHYEMRDESFSSPTPVPLISGCCMLARTEVLKKLKGFDERYFLYLEDYDLCRRIAQAGYTLVMNPDVHIVHGHGQASYRWGRALLLHLTSAVKYFNRWGWRN
ncbi:glycosyltransferase [Chitinilyticum aquatile]|uniref:glycosyltransferase n=1 Tax=Chitinilyticum aquatile TaxID=362520 RepID=UPI00138B1184|nr:glycosyltransferase family 2 protein [Chitinilyticum aquatile]